MYKGRQSEHSKNLDQTRMTNVTRNAENQGDALQKQIQSYTRKFEQQKRKLFRAEQNYRQILKDFQNHQADLKSVKQRKYLCQVSNLNADIKSLQMSLQNGITAYNQALSKNNILKAQIDELRKDKKNQKQAFRILTQKIEELNSSIQQMDNNISTKKDKVQKTKQGILQIKDKNENKNTQYAKYIEVLKEEDSFTKQKLKNSTIKQATQASDTQPIVKLRIKNLMLQNKQKIRITELYKKSMEKIEQSFEQIKQESGIYDLEQITKTFLKQEQQNTLIYQFIHKLSTELQISRQQNDSLSKKIANYKQALQESRKLLGGTPQQQRQKNKIQSYCSDKNKHITKLNDLLLKIEPGISELLNVSIDGEAHFLSYTNVQNYLAQLEVMIQQQCEPDSKQQNSPVYVDQEFNKYSKIQPVISLEDLKDKNEQILFQHSKLRDYASEYWEKRRLMK